jgi:CBS domain-containing protein
VPDYLRRYIRSGVEPLHLQDSLKEAARRLSVEQLTDLPVVDDDGRIAGLFGEKELIVALSPSYLGELSDTSFVARDFEDIAAEARKVMDEPIERFMRREYATLHPDFSVLHICELFLHRRQGVIPIVDQGKPIGLIRRSDIGRGIIEGAAKLSEQETRQVR